MADEYMVRTYVKGEDWMRVHYKRDPDPFWHGQEGEWVATYSKEALEQLLLDHAGFDLIDKTDPYPPTWLVN